MSRPDQEAIDTFVSITGASESVAVHTLQAHGRDLNQAVNAYFSGDRISTREVTDVVSDDDAMDIDETVTAAGNLNPFNPLDPGLTTSFFDSGPGFGNRNPTPFVTHPREVREIPIEVKDGGEKSGHSGQIPDIEDVTGINEHGPEILGTVTVDDDDEVIPNTHAGFNAETNERRNDLFSDVLSRGTYPSPSAPGIDDLPDYNNDIEEQMIRAAIEASKREAGKVHSDKLFGDQEDSRASGTPHQSIVEDPDLAHAVSLSLKTAEQEKALREPGESSELEAYRQTEMRDTGKRALSNGRLDVGSSSVQDEAEDVEEQPLVRHRSRRIASAISSKEEVDVDEVTPPSSPEQSDTLDHPTKSGSDFSEWGGISSEEHDEAVMLEAAMFGGIPENSGYRLPYAAPHHYMQNGINRNSSFYSSQYPRPPSPSLVAQRLIREQQDDEYLASLQADREKAEAQRLEEEAARIASLEAERLEEEETRRKLEAEQEIERQLAAKDASLPPEPTSDDENSVTLLVRMPDGSRRGRRFLKTDKLQYLFDFIDVGRVVKPGTYKLVRPYPRRAFSDGESSLSLYELGLTSKQEALFLELIKH